MLKKILKQRLERQVERAVSLGAMSTDEAAIIRSEVAFAPDLVVLLELLILVAQAILAWLSNRNVTNR